MTLTTQHYKLTTRESLDRFNTCNTPWLRLFDWQQMMSNLQQ